MARSRSADYDSQRDRILALAVRAFAETGYASATMAALASACGTSKARLYHYYPSKEAILFDSLDRYTARLGEIVAYDFWEKADADHTIVRFCTSWATRVEDVDAFVGALANW